MQYFKTNYPHLNVYPIGSHCARISDLRGDRVWLNYDSNNKISDIPVIS